MTGTEAFEGKKVHFSTLGCKLNFAETSHLGRLLTRDLGMEVAEKGEEADFCLVNTCSVTEMADKKSRQLIHRLHRENPRAHIIVTGCYAQLKPGEISKIDGVDLVLGAAQKGDLVKYLLMIEKGELPFDQHVLTTPIGEADTFVPSVSAEGRTRHFLKVQDGCDYRCSYCTIPKARGKSRNGSIADLITQARGVAEEGGKEIVLTGVNVGDFGKSTGDTFLDLIRALDEVEGIERYRISSIEPNLLTPEIIDFVSASRRFAPHFHIPLQSGSNEVLGLMRRRYRREVFEEKIRLIKDAMPEAFIGVDVIVGARGETADCFEDGRAFIDSLPVTKLHVFPYSERPGTDALAIPYSVSQEEKHRRSHVLLEISEKKHLDFIVSQIGSAHKVLWEHAVKDGQMYGFTENYVRVRHSEVADHLGIVTPVRLTGMTEEAEVAAAEILPF